MTMTKQAEGQKRLPAAEVRLYVLGGFLSAEFPELAGVPIERIKDAVDRFRAAVPGDSPLLEQVNVGE